MSENILDQIAELKDKAARYDNMRERNLDYAKGITEARDILTAVLADMEPWKNATGKNGRQKRSNHSEELKELTEKMTAGLEVSFQLIKDTYRLPDNQTYAIFNKLRRLKNIIERKDGKKIYLLVRKEV